MTNNSRNIRQDELKVKKTRIKFQPKTKKAFVEKPLFFILIVLALTFITFLPSLKNDFISSWDDDLFVINNVLIRHLDFQSVKSIFTTPVYGAYCPLPVLTFALEYHFFGLNPLPYHISNLILHLICTLFVFQFFKLLQLNSIYAAFGAILFGIHPMNVESVAWITERKDLLYGLFYLASIIVYLKYIRAEDRRINIFIFVLLLFIFALFSKILAVTLPISLILIDFYTQRPGKLKLFIEKIPFVVLSLVFGLAGIFILKEQHILQSSDMLSLSEKIFLGLYALSGYIVKFFAPFHLSAVYPFPKNPAHTLPLLYYLNLFFLLIMGSLVYRTIRHTRVVIFALLFFLFNVIFVLQILSAGSTFLADRYSYISYVGFCFIAGWSVEKFIDKKKELKPFFFSVMVILIILFMSLTFNRCNIWKNAETLWTDAIEKYPDQVAIPYCNRGSFYNDLKQWDKAISDCSTAIAIEPNFAEPYTNRGVAYANLGEWNKTISDCSRAIEIDPNFSKEAYSNRGVAYVNFNEWDKAIDDYSRAIRINPNLAEAYLSRGLAYGAIMELEPAIADFPKRSRSTRKIAKPTPIGKLHSIS